jgi:hypothetical protein
MNTDIQKEDIKQLIFLMKSHKLIDAKQYNIISKAQRELIKNLKTSIVPGTKVNAYTVAEKAINLDCKICSRLYSYREESFDQKALLKTYLIMLQNIIFKDFDSLLFLKDENITGFQTWYDYESPTSPTPKTTPCTPGSQSDKKDSNITRKTSNPIPIINFPKNSL